MEIKNGLSGSRWWLPATSPADARAVTASSRLGQPVFLPQLKPKFSISKNCNIFAIGSCFAREIEVALLRRDLNVISFSEELISKSTPRHPPQLTSVDERIYRMGYMNKFTIGSIVDELRWATEGVRTQYPMIQKIHEERFVDTAAHNILSGDEFDMVLGRRIMLNQILRRIFEADVVIITLGLAEGWLDTETGIRIVDSPVSWRGSNPDRYKFELLSYEDHMQGLAEIRSMITSIGKPRCRIIVSVSPVPLLATFTGKDIVVANNYSKSVIRAAVEEFVSRYSDVDYFPSYEMTMYSNEDVWMEDKRHVQPTFVDKITNHFVKHYIE